MAVKARKPKLTDRAPALAGSRSSRQRSRSRPCQLPQLFPSGGLICAPSTHPTPTWRSWRRSSARWRAENPASPRQMLRTRSTRERRLVELDAEIEIARDRRSRALGHIILAEYQTSQSAPQPTPCAAGGQEAAGNEGMPGSNPSAERRRNPPTRRQSQSRSCRAGRSAACARPFRQAS